MSRTGVPSKYVPFSTSMTLPWIPTILHVVKAIRFGRNGKRIANTPVSGFDLPPRG